MFTRFLPLAGIIALIAVGIVWRSWIQYRRYGVSGIALFRATNWRQRIRDSLFFALFAGTLAQAIVFAIAPAVLTPLTVVPAAWTAPLALVGGPLVVVGLAITVAAQLGMGASWRIGIDETARPGLVTSGLYRFCRNPIYLGMLTMVTGLTALEPTALSLVLGLTIYWCIRTQTLEEEIYLERTYGLEFVAYAGRVGRFVPGLGRLVKFS